MSSFLLIETTILQSFLEKNWKYLLKIKYSRAFDLEHNFWNPLIKIKTPQRHLPKVNHGIV